MAQSHVGERGGPRGDAHAPAQENAESQLRILQGETRGTLPSLIAAWRIAEGDDICCLRRRQLGLATFAILHAKDTCAYHKVDPSLIQAAFIGRPRPREIMLAVDDPTGPLAPLKHPLAEQSFQ